MVIDLNEEDLVKLLLEKVGGVNGCVLGYDTIINENNVKSLAKEIFELMKIALLERIEVKLNVIQIEINFILDEIKKMNKD